MSLQLHELNGCSPEPLANYLKALGILRLIVEQGADPQARGWWEHERFRLLTKLTHEELEEFFLARYAPTPLLSPWNKGCGFFKPGDPGLAPLEKSTAERFAAFRSGIRASRRLLDEQSDADAVIRAIKARTKTNKAFQTPEQRERLLSSDVFRAFSGELRARLAQADLSVSQRQEVTTSLADIEILAAPASRPPTAAEAKQLKESPSYKRLLAAADRRYKALKETLIPGCRRDWRGGLADWLASAVALDGDGTPVWPSLLGTGGNDGNLDFTNNFMQRLGTLFEVTTQDGRPRPATIELLANALWASNTNRLESTAVGQFNPGAAGGANSSTGTMGEGQINPWDFVLMMEGAVIFSTRATRRLDPNSFSRAAAPFAVRSHAAGYGSSGDEKSQRGEQWLPLWGRPATLAEVSALFGEARVQLGRQTANRPVDVARAISRLGVARGVDSFIRYGYLERNGQSTLAVPLGRMDVHEAARSHLMDDLAPWMDRLQRAARGKNAPNRLKHAERQLADAVMAALSHDDTTERWQAILLAAVAVERLQSTGCALEAGPIPSLRPDWISAAGDSAEVRLAVALGSSASGYSRSVRAVNPVRHHWLPLERGARRFQISQKRLVRDERVVMTGRSPLADCAALVERRMIEAGMMGQRRLPLVAAPGCGARLGDLAAFLSGQVDPERVLDLARAFMAIRWDTFSGVEHERALNRPERPAADLPPEGWLALRLACLPWPLQPGQNIPSEPGMIRRLLSGDSAGAVSTALARLRSAGIRPPLRASATDRHSALLWAAGLVFPIDYRAAQRVAAVLDPKLKGNRNV